MHGRPVGVVISAIVTLGFSMASAQIGFDPAVSYAIGTNPSGVTLGNLNGDLWPDMAVTSDTPDKVTVRLNNGAGGFGGPTNISLPGGSGPDGVVAVNVDNDLDLDLVVALKNIDSVVVLTSSGGVFTPGTPVASSGLETRALAAADLDGNGFVDVVASNRSSDNVSVFLNTGGILGAGTTYAAGLRPRGVALADLDGDLDQDLAVAASDSREVEVLLNLGNGTFGTATPLSVGTELRPEGVTARDLDGDGDVDLAASTSGAIGDFATVFLNTGSGTFGAGVNYPVGGVNPAGIVAADLDGDGDPDLATANQDSGTVSAIANSGAATFGAATLFGVGNTPEVLARADLDGNGSADLVTSNRNSGDASVLLNLGSSLVFGDGFELGSTTGWSAVLP